jgi:lysophospholipase L1-like esterase
MSRIKVFSGHHSKGLSITFKLGLGVFTWVGGWGLLPFLQGREKPDDLEKNPPSVRTDILPSIPTLFIAGDSTAAKGHGSKQQGWAEPFKDFFDRDKVTVFNRARGGRSSRTFITEGLWQELLDDVKPGDVVLIQFGHNDGGAINEEPPGSTRPTRARGTLPGLGDDSVEIVHVITGQPETVYTFGHYMRKMIRDTRGRGATPVLLSLTMRNLRDERGRLERGNGHYGAWTYQLAQEEGAPFIDLTNLIADQLDAMEASAVDALFEQDYVHFNLEGAQMHAACVVSALKGLRDVRLEAWLSELGRSVEADNTTWLQLPIQENRSLPTIFLIGDSTVRNGRGDGKNGEWGWGDFFAAWLYLEKVNLVNRAVGGTSSRTFQSLGFWNRVKAMLQPGDVVILQFGHNDSSPINDNQRARGTLPGAGTETETIHNQLTGEVEEVLTYGGYLRRFVQETRAIGATPVICSPVPRKKWENRRVLRGVDSYGDWAEQVAVEEDVAFVDLEARIAEAYDQLGPKQVQLMFADLNTHTSCAGAVLNANMVVQGLRALGRDNPLEKWLRN